MKKKFKFNDCHFVPIVGDGAIASYDTAEGRAIPVLILDCSNHRELLNLIYTHQNTPPGDVSCTWGINKENAYLLFDFTRPSEASCGVYFNLENQTSLADGIVHAQGVILQPSESGTKVIEGLNQPKILVEVSPKTKLPDWDKQLLKAIQRKMRREGLPRQHAKNASKEFLARTRELWTLRMKS